MPFNHDTGAEGDARWCESRRRALTRPLRDDEAAALDDLPAGWWRAALVVPHRVRADARAGRGTLLYALAAPSEAAGRAASRAFLSGVRWRSEPDLAGLVVLREIGPAR